MLNYSIISKLTDFLLFLRISIINISERSNDPDIPILYQETKDILLFQWKKNSNMFDLIYRTFFVNNL